jgi:hypothetical protein
MAQYFLKNFVMFAWVANLREEFPILHSKSFHQEFHAQVFGVHAYQIFVSTASYNRLPLSNL